MAGGDSPVCASGPIPRSCPTLGRPLPNKEFSLTSHMCVLDTHPHPQGLLSWGGYLGGVLTGPPPSSGGDQPAPASLESRQSQPGTPKAEEEGSEAAPGAGVLGLVEGRMEEQGEDLGVVCQGWGMVAGEKGSRREGCGDGLASRPTPGIGMGGTVVV